MLKNIKNMFKNNRKEVDEFEEYFSIFKEAEELKKDDPLAALEKYVYILDNYRPIGTSYYTEPADLFCKLCRYDEAIFCLGRAKENIEVFDESTQLGIINEFPSLVSNVDREKTVFDKVLKTVKDNPGVVQSKIYKEADIGGNKARSVIYNMDKSGYLKRERYKSSYKLFPTGKAIHKDYIVGF